VAKDDEEGSKCEGKQRERDEEKRTETALPEGPAIDRQVIGAANAFHQCGENAGGSGEANKKSDEDDMGRSDIVGRLNEVTFEERADVGGENAIEEGGELEAEGSGIGQETDDRGGGDERRKERHDGRVGCGLGQV
jgi:hypothetical protein